MIWVASLRDVGKRRWTLAKKVVTVPDVNGKEIVGNLAEHMAARMAELGIDSVSELAKLAGVSREGLVPMVRGVRKQYQRRLTRPVCDALGWSHDSIERLLAGDPPVIASAPATPLLDVDARLAQIDEKIDEVIEVVAANRDNLVKLLRTLELLARERREDDEASRPAVAGE